MIESSGVCNGDVVILVHIDAQCCAYVMTVNVWDIVKYNFRSENSSYARTKA